MIKMATLPSCGRVNITVLMHYCVIITAWWHHLNETIGEKFRWKLHKNVTLLGRVYRLTPETLQKRKTDGTKHFMQWPRRSFDSCVVLPHLIKWLHVNSDLEGNQIKKIHRNADCCFKQILEATPYKTAALLSLASHLTNHPCKTNNSLLVK